MITCEELLRVHGAANFGPMTPREVVNEGVLKYAMGYSGGSTQIWILYKHGLITKPKRSKASLTEKGKAYLREQLGRNFDEVLSLMKDPE